MIQGNVIYRNPEWKFKVEIRISNPTQLKFKREPIEFYACLIARNGEIVFTGETRKRKSALIKTVNNLFPGVKIVDVTPITPSSKGKKK
jgi:hypothetical protein